MEATVIAQLAAPALGLIPVIIAIVAALKKSVDFVTNKNAALVSGVVGVLLGLGVNLVGIFDPALSHGAAALAGGAAGLMATGGYALVKGVGVKKEEDKRER